MATWHIRSHELRNEVEEAASERREKPSKKSISQAYQDGWGPVVREEATSALRSV